MTEVDGSYDGSGTTRNPKSPPVRFGLFELDRESARLRKAGIRIRLQRQPLQVLEALLSKPGELVTREELRAVLWPEEPPDDFDHRLNKAINKVRTALGDAAENPRFVETLARQGYRFIAPVEIVEPPPPLTAGSPPAPPPGPGNPRPRGKRWPLVVAGLLATGIIVLLWFGPPAREAAVASYHQLTNDGRQKMDGIGTDNNRVYFVEFVDGRTRLARVPVEGGATDFIPISIASEESVFILDVGPKSGRLLLKTSSGLDHDLADGALWLVPPAGGEARRLGDLVANDAKWSPDETRLAYFTGAELWLGDAQGLNRRRLADKPGINSAIRWSPDGRRIRFRSGYPSAEHSTIWEIPVSGGELRASFPGWNFEQHCGAWAGRGAYFLFFSPSDSNLWIVPEKWAWLGRAKPQRLTSGPLKFRSPRMSPDGKSLVAIGEVRRGELIRWNAARQMFQPYLAGLSADQLHFSLDGQWVTYATFPEAQIWVSRTDWTERRQLTSDPLRTYLPRLSPDNRRVAFMGRGPGEQWKIYMMPADGGPVEQLVAGDGPEADPNWSPDGKKIVFAPFPWDVRPEVTGVRILDLESRRVEFVQGSEGMFSPRWSPDGARLAAIRHTDSALMVCDLNRGVWRVATSFQCGFPAWSGDGLYVYAFHAFTEKRGIYRVAVDSGAVELVAGLSGIDVAGIQGPYGLSMDPDDSPIVLQDDSIQEIYSLELDLP